MSWVDNISAITIGVINGKCHRPAIRLSKMHTYRVHASRVLTNNITRRSGDGVIVLVGQRDPMSDGLWRYPSLCKPYLFGYESLRRYSVGNLLYSSSMTMWEAGVSLQNVSTKSENCGIGKSTSRDH